MKKLLFITSVLLGFSSYAQSGAGALIQGGVDDGEILLKAYLSPINKAIVFGLSNTTYSKFTDDNDTKKLEISVKLANISIPDEDLNYDISNLNMQHLEAKDPTQTIAPSVFGDSIQTIKIASKERDLLGRPLFEFDAPTGSQKTSMPIPSLTVSYRMKGTTIGANIIPPVTVPKTDMKVGLFGVSIQQDLATIVSSLENKPFGISIQGNASFLTGKSNLDVKPGDVYVPVTLNGSTTGPYDNQEIKINYSSIQLGTYFDYTVAKKYTFFGGAAYNMGTSNIKALGTYPVYASDPSGLTSVVGEDIDDPIDISESFDRVKFEIGARADWNSFYLQLNYNIATYGGVGFNLGYKL